MIQTWHRSLPFTQTIQTPQEGQPVLMCPHAGISIWITKFIRVGQAPSPPTQQQEAINCSEDQKFSGCRVLSIPFLTPAARTSRTPCIHGFIKTMTTRGATPKSFNPVGRSYGSFSRSKGFSLQNLCFFVQHS